MDRMTPEETNCLNILSNAWDEFIKLPELYPWERVQFMFAIHAAQFMLMSRPTVRLQLEAPKEENEHKGD